MLFPPVVYLPFAGLRSRIVFEDFHHQSCVVGRNETGLQHAQKPDLSLGLAEGSRGIDCHIGVQPLANGSDGGKSRADFKCDAGVDRRTVDDLDARQRFDEFGERRTLHAVALSWSR